MKVDNREDDDGFEEATIEIHTQLFKQQHSPYINDIQLPEANPLYISDGLDQLQLDLNQNFSRSDENYQKYNLIPQNYLEDQNLSQRLEKGFTQVYKKFNFIETSTLTTGVFKSIEWWKQQKDQIFKQITKQTLSFDSNFPTGNLWAVYQSSELNTYELLLQNDTSTNGYTQWFNFRINLIPPRTTIIIKIINLLKDYSHFDQGMIPLILKNQFTSEILKDIEIFNVYYSSNKKIKLKLIIQVQYYRNSIVHQELRKDGSIKKRKYHTLQFTIQNGDKFIDQAFISMNHPYSYERLCEFLDKQGIVSSIITKTYLGYDCLNFRLGTPSKRKVVVLARQHPGETVSSFVLEGVVKFLNQSQKPETKWLLQQAEFIIVPMVNIDGTQLGNFRCNTLGQDVNRIWDNPRKNSEIFALKQVLLQGPLDFFIDLHGHSKKMNTFIYGCRNEQDPISCRVYPKIMERICPFFSFPDCTYSINKDKVKTARAIVFNAQQNQTPNNQQNVFTLETSSYGYTADRTLNSKKIQFTIENLHSIGESLMMAIFYYWGGLKDPLFQTKDQKDFIDPNDIEKDLLTQGFQDNQLQESDSDAEIDLLPLKKQSIIDEEIKQEEEKLRPKSNKKRTRYNQRQKLSTVQKQKQVSFKPTQLHTQLLNVKALDSLGQKKIIEKQQNSIQISHLSRPSSPRKNETMIASYFSKHRTNGSQQVEGLRPHKVSLYTQQQSLSNQDMQIQGETMHQKFSSYRNPVGTPKDRTLVLKPLDHVRNTLIIEKNYELPPTFSNAQQTLRRQLQGMIFEQKREERQRNRLEIVRKDTKRKNIFRNNANSQIEKQIPQSNNENKIRIKHRQESINQGKTAVLSGEDIYMSQLLRDIWKMNQLKYGQQILQPKPIKLFTPTEENEEYKIFDDKKLQRTREFNIRSMNGQNTKQNFSIKD